ncbi:phosphotransferase enzyme family protein [Actinoplanes friuliensis]|uniref:Aminoglycoside phosphotransferase n=1 Tax=Actinoplanes friuliensis DSM 7358 TaxID=1246995 RepID=U5W0A3_9ACTN|nr:phosphotransferase [Actinoplanes friuliensis]AGZ42638.1 aminoglycoside phosphotransferase [Actinoplanes friuliensis DSM 7358]
MTEELLAGGNVADQVVRAGDTVRKPWTAATPAIHAFLRHLSAKGVEGVPGVLGRDEQGRQVLAFVPGVQGESAPPMTVPELHRLGGLVRALHDASADFVFPPGAVWECAIPPDGADLVCHQDLAPWNLIRDGDTWTFIDWDASAPGTRLWDLAYVAQTFAPLLAGGDPATDAKRLRAVVDGYGLDDAGRKMFPEKLVERTRAMYDLLENGSRTGVMPWSRLWDEGHGVHWGGAADYLAAHLPTWRSVLQ